MQGSIESSHVPNFYKKEKAGRVLTDSPRLLKTVKLTYFDFSSLDCHAKCADLVLELGWNLLS